jgi:hypothetical protein
MAIAHVQTVSARAGSGTAASVQFSGTPLTAGNAVVIHLAFYTPATTVSSQSSGDTCTAIQTLLPAGGWGFLYQAYVTNIAGGNTTFTFNSDGSAAWTIYASEVSGMAASGLDQFANAGADTTSTDHATGTTSSTTQADEIAFGCVDLLTGAGVSNLVNLDSWTIPTNGIYLTSGGLLPGAIAYTVLTSTGAQSTTFRQTETTDGFALIGTFKAAVAGGGPVFVPVKRMVGVMYVQG